jgi:putative RNA 2'-phosphotransferase
MNKTHQTKISKYLSKHLRHTPERLEFTLAPGSWVSIDTLLAACTAYQFPITPAELEAVVVDSGKQRFSFDEAKTLIRANQGHSQILNSTIRKLIHATEKANYAITPIW